MGRPPGSRNIPPAPVLEFTKTEPRIAVATRGTTLLTFLVAETDRAEHLPRYRLVIRQGERRVRTEFHRTIPMAQFAAVKYLEAFDAPESTP